MLVGPSPRYIDDEGYTGGFTRQDIEELLESMESNFLGWSSAMAPAIMANADRPELGEELTESFCRTDPDIAARFARATFLSDNRADLAGVSVPTLVLQCSDDVIAPDVVGEYVHARIPGLRVRQARSHRPLPEPERPARDHGSDPGLRLKRGRVVAGSEQSAEELYEQAPCGYLSAEPGGRIVRVNETFLRWTGYAREDLVDVKRFQDLLTAGGRIYHETHYAPLLRMQGSVREIAVDIVCADGRRLPVLINSVLLTDAAGEPRMVRTMLFDATERKLYERELLAARDRERGRARRPSGCTPRRARSPTRCSRACSRETRPTTRASASPRSISPPSATSRSAATGTTRSPCPATSSGSPSATSSGAASPPRRRWDSCAAPSARSRAPGCGRRRSCATSTRSSSSRRRASTRRSPTPRSTRPRARSSWRPPGTSHRPDRRRRSTPLFLGGRSTPLGIPLPGLPRTEATFTLAPGAGFVLYTDGLVERRTETIDVGLARLLDVLRTEDRPERLVDALLEAGAIEDDVCILVFRRT